MPVICFEGASAAGKSSVSKYLRDNFNAFVMPEVNLLFHRSEPEPKFWYLERQVERWQMALEDSTKHEIVILDGDAFQPLWYNWSYDFDFGEPFEDISGFYRKRIAAGEIDFPDRYFILTASPDELKIRKIADASRTRKNFERHLRFIQPQTAYFSFIKSKIENLVEFIENEEIEKTAETVINSIGKDSYPNGKSSLALFDEIVVWLENTKP